MNSPPNIKAAPPMFLDAATAADLMVANPLSIAAGAYLSDAAAFLADKGFSAAPVIDEAGRAIGVLSQSDIVLRSGSEMPFVSTHPEFYDIPELTTQPRRIRSDVVDGDPTQVRDIMTPLVIAVAPETPVNTVIEGMLDRKVHRLFVVDDDGVLVGIISTVDVLRHLHLKPQ